MTVPHQAQQVDRSPALQLWQTRTVDVAAIAFLASIACFILSSIFDLGVFELLLAMAGTASCGFSWLLARAVFRSDAGRELWPLGVVGVLILTGVVLHLFSGARSGDGPFAVGLGMAASIQGLVSSTVLLLALVEAGLGYSKDLPAREKGFRAIFAGAYGGLIAISVIWLAGALEGSWADRHADTVRMVCAGLAAALAVCAWRYRARHPHPKTKRKRRQVLSVSEEESALADRILRALKEDEVYLEPDLKLTDLAARLRAPDYKVRNAITGPLGFANFNQMINHFRIEAAKDALVQADNKPASILNVALECGFSSIGPFNRAFKLETGQTPSAFRNAHLNRA